MRRRHKNLQTASKFIAAVLLSASFIGCISNKPKTMKTSDYNDDYEEYEKNNVVRNTENVHLNGNEYDYIVSKYKNDDSSVCYFNIDIQKDGKSVQSISQSKDKNAIDEPKSSDIVNLADVDFDGKEDLLVYQGSFGVQRASSYKCYLFNDGDYPYTILEGFENIQNPAIDSNKKRILSFNREGADSSTYTVYKIEDNKLIKESYLKVLHKENLLSDCTVYKEVDGKEQVVSESKDINFLDTYSNDGYFDVDSDNWKHIGIFGCGTDDCY